MTVEVHVEVARSMLIAAVQREVRIGEIGSAWGPALDLVWKFLHGQPGLHAGGHNVFLYHHPARRDLPMQVDFGVQVTRTFEPSGEVRPVQTPAGEVACAVHVGAYQNMRATHDAIHAWAAQHRRRIGAASWEIYGDWTDDPAKLETTICYLLSAGLSAGISAGLSPA